MKKCVSCTKDLPDAALHCVFCGAKQPQPAAPAEPAMAKTMMGYQAADLLKNLPKPAAQPPAPAPAPAPAPQPPPSGAAQAATMFLDGPPPQVQPQPPQPAQPPPPSGAAQAATMFMDGPPPQVQPHQHAHQPPPAHQPHQHAHQPPPAQPFAPPPPQPFPPPAAYAPPPVAPPGYLAPQPHVSLDVFGRGLQLVLIVFGALLLAAFVVPFDTDPMVFWWDALGEIDGSQKLMPIFLAAAGLLGVILGSIPLPSTGRGVAALALGAAPLLYAALVLPEEFAWQGAAISLGSILLPAGLLLRTAFREASLGRILATVGSLLIIIPYLVPVNDKMPIVAAFDGIANARELGPQIAYAGAPLRLLLAALGLLVWLPAPSRAGAKAIAWLWILTPIVLHYAILIGAGEIGDVVGKSPNIGLFAGLEAAALTGGRGGDLALLVPSGVLAAGYIAFAGYGLAALLGKSLER